MGWGTLPEVRDGSRDLLGGSEQVRRSSERSGTSWEVLPVVWTLSGDPFRGLGRVGGGTLEGSRQVRRSTGRSGTGRKTLPKVRDGLGDPRGGPGRVRGTPGGLGQVG